jgi:hypothetical protein
MIQHLNNAPALPFQTTSHPLLQQLKMDAMTHHFTLSLQKLRGKTKRAARCTVLRIHWLNRTAAVVADAHKLCRERLNMDATANPSFNTRKAAMSYFQVVYPADFPEDQVAASRAFVASYEALMQEALRVDEIGAFSEQACRDFIDGLQKHMDVFGGETPTTPEENLETMLARFESLAFAMTVLGEGEQRLALIQEIADLEMELVTMGCADAVAAIRRLVPSTP